MRFSKTVADKDQSSTVQSKCKCTALVPEVVTSAGRWPTRTNVTHHAFQSLASVNDKTARSFFSTALTQPSDPASLPADLFAPHQDWDTSWLYAILPHLHSCSCNTSCKCWIFTLINVIKSDDSEALFFLSFFLHVCLSWLHSWRAALGHLLKFAQRIQLQCMDWLYSHSWIFNH